MGVTSTADWPTHISTVVSTASTADCPTPTPLCFSLFNYSLLNLYSFRCYFNCQMPNFLHRYVTFNCLLSKSYIGSCFNWLLPNSYTCRCFSFQLVTAQIIRQYVLLQLPTGQIFTSVCNFQLPLPKPYIRCCFNCRLSHSYSCRCFSFQFLTS